MDKEFLFRLDKNDFEITYMRAGGPGGQKQNKTSSACRILHKASGAFSESRTDRHQHINKKLAFERLIDNPVFKKWLKMEIARKSGILDEVEKIVDEQMNEENIKIEVVDENTGKWKEETC